MKITVSRKELVTALGIVKNATPTRAGYPILEHALIEAEKNAPGRGSAVHLTCTDNSLFVRVQLNATIETVGKTTTKADLLHNIVKSLPDAKGEAEMTLKVQDNAIQIGTGAAAAKYRLGTKNPAEFPQVPKLKKCEGEITLPQPELKRLLATVFHASEQVDESRYVLAGVYFKINRKKGELTLTATDGRRLASVHCAAPNLGWAKGPDCEVIVPNGAIKFLLNLLGDEDNVTMSFHDDRVYFKLGTVEILSALIAGNYPNYKKLIPEDAPKTALLNRLELLTSLKRLALLNKIVSFRFNKRQLSLQSRSDNLDYPGDAAEVLELDTAYSGEFKVNAHYFIGLLESVADENIRLQAGGKGVPILLKADDWFCLVMPMGEPQPPAKPPEPAATKAPSSVPVNAQTPVAKGGSVPSRDSAPGKPSVPGSEPLAA